MSRNWFMSWTRSAVIRLPIETDFQDLNPWDSFRADLEISRFLRVASKYGSTLHIKRVVADYRFDDDAPYAIAVEPAESYFACTIILNATYRTYFAQWKRGQRILRLAWLLSAFFATLDASHDHAAGRPPFLRFELSPSPQLTIDTIVIAARSRYLIDKRINRALFEQLGVTLNDLLCRSFGRSGLDLTIAAMDRASAEIPRFIGSPGRPDTQEQVRTWMSCSLHIWSMMSALASLSAQLDETKEWTAMEQALSTRPVFAAWVASSWQSLHSDWRASAGRELGANRTVERSAADSIRQVYERAGIRVRPNHEMGPAIEFLATSEGPTA